MAEAMHSSTAIIALVEALVDQGFQVTAFDAPGHGRSSGRSTDIHEISGFIEQLLDETGSDTAVIAHSFGCMCALNAIAKGAGVSAVVCISPPKDVTTLLLQYQKILDLNNAVVKSLKQRLEQRLGEDMWSRFSMPEWVSSADIPGLIIHDSRDRYVPVSNGKQIHAAWADSKLQITKGLIGINRVRLDRFPGQGINRVRLDRFPGQDRFG